MEILAVRLEEKLRALQANPYFVDLSAPILHDLSSGTSLRQYQAGEVLFWEGDPCAGLHIIQRGSVKLFKTSLHGRELIINVIEEDTTFNEVPVFDGGLNPVNAAALENSLIWVIEAEVIRRAIEQHPEMSAAVIANLSQNLRMLVGKVEELSFYQITNRLARLISQLPEEQLSGSAAARLTQDQLAARLGTVREVVARALRELERSGAIRVDRRQIRVLDESILRDWALCLPEGS